MRVMNSRPRVSDSTSGIARTTPQAHAKPHRCRLCVRRTRRHAVSAGQRARRNPSKGCRSRACRHFAGTSDARDRSRARDQIAQRGMPTRSRAVCWNRSTAVATRMHAAGRCERPSTSRGYISNAIASPMPSACAAPGWGIGQLHIGPGPEITPMCNRRAPHFDAVMAREFVPTFRGDHSS
jgi:hypothetical protein